MGGRTGGLCLGLEATAATGGPQCNYGTNESLPFSGPPILHFLQRRIGQQKLFYADSRLEGYRYQFLFP
jgi:hypothetical protein